MCDGGAAAAKARLTAGTRVLASAISPPVPLCDLNCVHFGGNGVFRLLCRPWRSRWCSGPKGNEGNVTVLFTSIAYFYV